MVQSTAKRSEPCVDRVLSLVRERVAARDADLVAEFVRQYYDGTAEEDMEDSAAVDLYGAAVSHFNFIRQRAPCTPKIRVYNPQAHQHGWQSTHTILEIVTDDMPFLVDSIRLSLNARGLTIHLVIHPVMRVIRDADGNLVRVVEANDSNGEILTEAVMHVEIDRQTEQDVLEGIVTDITTVLGDVALSVRDWSAMRGKLKEILAELTSSPPPLEVSELVQAQAFLEWINDDHFTFLGYRGYDLLEEGGEDVLRPVVGSGLGLLRDQDTGEISKSFSILPSSVRKLAREPRLLIITKANSRSTVHRPGYMDYVGVKRFDAEGRVIGERRFLGLYTSAAYNRIPRAIPLLREKVARVMARAGYPANSHAAKALLNILENFPRDLLFQVSDDELFESGIGILHLQERQRIRLFIHRDRYGRYCSCIVYVPRDRFNTDTRLAMQKILMESLHASEAEFTVQLSESVLARLYFELRIPVGAEPDYDVADIERRLHVATRVWTDDLYDVLMDQHGEEYGTRLYRKYRDGFMADYRQHYAARLAVHDIDCMERLGDAANDIAMSLYRPLEADDDVLQFKLFRVRAPVSLSDALPMLENMGLRVEDERPSEITCADGTCVWMHDFGLRRSSSGEFDLDRIKEKFQDAFARIWKGDVDNDGFNRLVIRAQLDWREIVVLRAYCKFLRQAKATFSEAYIANALVTNHAIATALVRLFESRFDPAIEGERETQANALADDIKTALDAVENLDEDRILRSFLGAIGATLRTNFYQRDAHGQPREHLSFKFDPSKIPELPQPRPRYEIFVYSPRVEGVHLRGGPVARGGLRWSDRREDFRTEVLGLVKAQMVKNAVIVPVGSKGGFVPKRLPPPSEREAMLAEGQACYRTFIRGMLDITDNLAEGSVVAPAQTVRYDGDDPYLVVAADKGTATFSDIANSIATEYGFWLGDAFASGGSQGYDHKGMGITAKGAWESVKRHFRELGLDTQSSEFTVVGIGDMSGDVFGNGMLLSEQIKLVGAFNHLHVFLDPDPDPARTFAERKRMFELPRSTWDDFDRSCLSEGGGVFSRAAKSIPLSPRVRELLQVEALQMTPNELIQALLRAPVDLLWNGGIGTYVKSSDEQHADAGDRANDAVRVDADELRCRVVGEGGNLGFTQLARIEFASRAGRIFTDAIDNAGGVDCSDHEVNIKILLNEIVASGDMTVKQRNTLLAKMTDDVGRLVLRNNYLQTQALSLALPLSPSLFDVHVRLIKRLERDGDLDRGIEFLPFQEEIDQRVQAGRGLTAPEQSVLMAYVKITLFQDLLGSSLPDDACVVRELVGYFPEPLRGPYGQMMPAHRLSREIISTVVANEIVNRCGASFVFRLEEETGASAEDIARAYLAAREIYSMVRVWTEIEALDNLVPAGVQIDMLLETRKLVERSTRWLLRNRPRPLDVDAEVDYFASSVATLGGKLHDLLPPAGGESMSSTSERLVGDGVPESLARRVAAFDELFSSLDITEVANGLNLPVNDVAAVYFSLGAKLDLHWMRDRIVALPRENRWQALARAALRDDLYAQEAALTRDVLQLDTAGEGVDERIDSWVQRNGVTVARCAQIMSDLRGGVVPDFTMLSVAMGEIRALRQMTAPGGSGAAGKRASGSRRKSKGKAA